MAISLYDLGVPTFLQTVRAVAGFLDRAAAHCANIGADPDSFVNMRLFEDMAPFHFQIEAAWHHAVWGFEAMRTGTWEGKNLDLQIGPRRLAFTSETLTSRSRSRTSTSTPSPPTTSYGPTVYR